MEMNKKVNSDRILVDSVFMNDVWGYVTHFEALGITNNDRVLVSAENSYTFILTFFSLAQTGCSIVLADSSLNDGELMKIVEDSDSNICISDKIIYQNGRSIKVLTLPIVPPSNSIHKGNINIQSWIERNDALILYSSGSTGNPKGIIKSGKSFMRNIRATIKRMEYYETDVLLPLIPFTHFYGLSIIFVWWMVKCELILCNYRSIRSIVKAITEQNVTAVDAVPSTYYMLNRLFSKREVTYINIKNSNVRMWCVGGSPLPRKLSREFRKFINMPLLDGYGLSEVGNVALNNNGPEFGCGKPLEDVFIKIIDRNEEELPPRKTGEIMVKSPGVMEKYNNLQETTNSAFRNGWFKTNDLGFIDKLGNLFVVGRKGDGILRKGYIIYPASIEKKLEDNLGIKCKVVSFNDEKRGSFVILLVENNNTEELKSRINDSLSSIFKPDKINIVQNLPILANGKLDYKSIQTLAYQLNKDILEEKTCQVELL